MNEAAKVIPFRAEADKAFLENILGPEQEKKLVEIVDSLDKSGGWETEVETEMSSKDYSDVSKHSIKGGKAGTEDNQALAENATVTAQNELNALLDQLEPKAPIPKEQGRQTDRAPSPPSHVPGWPCPSLPQAAVA